MCYAISRWAAQSRDCTNSQIVRNICWLLITNTHIVTSFTALHNHHMGKRCTCGKQLCVQGERKMARVPISKMHVRCKVLARPSPKGTVPWGGGGSNVPFGPATKETMCPLAPPQNQHIFNSHLNHLNCLGSEYRTLTKYFVDSGTHATTFGSDIKMMGVVMRYHLCPLACKL